MQIKYIDIKEFVEQGFLQEANRQFFHPLGLAMSVDVSEDGEYSLGGIWDYRDDPEGIIFADNELSSEKARKVIGLYNSKIDTRMNNFSYIVQPVANEGE